jgi:hypothetical protein
VIIGPVGCQISFGRGSVHEFARPIALACYAHCPGQNRIHQGHCCCQADWALPSLGFSAKDGRAHPSLGVTNYICFIVLLQRWPGTLIWGAMPRCFECRAVRLAEQVCLWAARPHRCFCISCWRPGTLIWMVLCPFVFIAS